MGNEKNEIEPGEKETSKILSLKEAMGAIKTDTKFFLKEKTGIVILSSILLLMVWGYHGNIELLHFAIGSWIFPCEAGCVRIPILSFIPWDRELISFWGGALLLVVIPCCIVRFYFKQPLSMYGLALPAKGKRTTGFLVFLIFMALAVASMLIAAKDKDMQALYPFYKTFTSIPINPLVIIASLSASNFKRSPSI